MPPDMVDFHDVSCWPAADCAWEYNSRLALSNSAGIGGRHYAAGCLYSSCLPSDCLVIDDKVNDTPHAHIILDVSPIGGCTHCKSVVMIRQLLTPEGWPLFKYDTGSDIAALNDINTIATYNLLLRQHGTVGTVRGSKGDVGSMYALGTPRVLKDCISTCEYAANSKMPRDLLKQLVDAMARVGSFCFPDVMANFHDAYGGRLWSCAC
jgi:hypothetical protein